jgi:assimilatory nitrate reductase catalytic subunit
MTPAQWPQRCETGRETGCETSARLFGDGHGFPTTDGRARFVATPFRPPADPPDEASWPLVLNTGRVRDQWHTMTRTGRVPRLMAHRTEPLLDIHPEDAAALDLGDGGLARIDSRHGGAVMRVRFSADQRRGEIFAPMHWSDRFSSAGPVGRLVGAATDPVSGQPELKATPVRMAPVRACWRGFLVRRSEVALAGAFHWARVPLAGGHAYDLAGWEPLPGILSEAWILQLLGAPADAELITYADPGAGAFRYARLVDGSLDACIFLAGDGALLPDRNRLGEMLGGAVEGRARLDLVASVTTARADPGPIVCACFTVGLDTLRRAIVDRRLTSLADIALALRAGTNCGSCRPELSELLAAGRPAPLGG